MKKILGIFLALVLVLSLSLVTAVPVGAQANTWTVDDDNAQYPEADFNTIQAAIDDTTVLDGDTINVAAGIYSESIIIDKSLTIQGAGKADAVIDAGEASYGISMKGVVLDYVAIKDLTVENALHSNIRIDAATVTEVVIENVDLSGSVPADSGHWAGLGLQQGTVGNLLVKNCTFENIKRHGVRVDTGSRVDHLTVINSVFDTDEEALIIDGIPSQAGIESCGNIGNLTVSGSTFTGTVNGIRLFWYWTDRVTYSINSVDIEESTFEGNDVGFFFYIGDEAPKYEIGNIRAHGCSFAGNEWGVNFSAPESYQNVVIDATNNWWGATNGPYNETSNPDGLGNAVSGFVDFAPYLDSPVEAGTGAVSMTAASEEAVIGISVSPTFVDFGNITSGAEAVGDALTVKNTGNVRINVDAEIAADTFFDDANSKYFYTVALRLSGCPSDVMQDPGEPDPSSFGSWEHEWLFGLQPFWVNESRPLTTGLDCPSPIKAGTTYTGTVVFWAEQP